MAINREVRVDYVGRDRTQAAARSAADNVERINRRMASLSRSAINVQRAFSAITLGFAANNGFRELGELQDVLVRVSNLSSDYAGTQAFLAQQTDNLNITLRDAAKAYSDILVLQNTGYLSRNQARELFEGFQETAKKFGVGAGDIKLALRGLRQALTAGTVRAQEFDQVFDAIGAVLPDVAKNLGVSTKELLRLRSSASLSADALTKALIPALLESRGAAEAATENINSALSRLANAYQEALVSFEEPIGDGINAFSDASISAINAVVENADKLTVVGGLIAAAFGGRALAAVGSMIAAQTQSANVSVAHSQALARNNALLATQAANRLNIARREQASLVAQRQALQIQLAQTEAVRARLIINAQLEAARARELAGLAALRTANLSATTTTAALAASQRAATGTSLALAGATRTLTGALSLFGGPGGAAAIALGTITYLGLRQDDLTAATIGVVEATKDLNGIYGNGVDAALKESDARKQSLEEEIKKLRERKAEILNDGAPSGIFTFGTVDVDALLRNIQRQIDFTSDKLSKLRVDQSLIRDAKTTAEEFQSVADAMRNVVDASSLAEGLISKFLPDRAKIAELEKAMLDASAAFEPGDVDGATVTKAIQEEIDKLTGATKARKEYAQTIKDSRKELDQLNSSLLTEREKLEETFNNSVATVRLNVELGTINASTGTAVIAKTREKLQAELEKIDQKEIDAAERVREELARVQSQKLADYFAYQDRLAQAQSVINPESGEVARFANEVAQLKSEFGKSIASREDYYLLVESAAKQHAEKMNVISAELAENNKKFSEQSRGEQIAIVGDIASNFVSAFQKNVGQYITLTENMTDAERKQAIASNAINKRRFEENKKSSIAQAIISTLTGATRAYETVPYPANIFAAAAITAAGLRNVANIRGTSFGSSVGSGSAGGGGSLNSSSTSSNQSNNNSQQAPIEIHFHINDDLINQDALNKMSVNAVAKATQSRDLTYNNKRGYYQTNDEAA